MSNIAVPRPTDPALAGDLTDLVRTLLGAALLTALMLTLTPFVLVPDLAPGEGNLVNQLGYALLALAALACHLCFTDRRTALVLLRPTWLVMALWLIVTTTQAVDVRDAWRALAFTLAAMVAGTGALCLPPSAKAFRTCLAIACGTVLALSYFAVFAMPAVGVHSAFGAEGHHAGLWRGVYSHKNVAGPMMAAIFFFGLYLMRSRHRASGGLIMLLALVFVVQTGSRTAALLLPAVALSIVCARAIGGRVLAALGVAAMVLVLAAIIVALTVSPRFEQAAGAVLPDPTLTGRTYLWLYAIDLWESYQRHWVGFGFESFWRNAVVLASEPSRELAWDPRGAANGHSGYFDLLVLAGIPGLAIGVVMLVVLPLIDFMRTGTDRESARLADLFLMILAFLLLNAFLESFFFERGSPIWVTMWIAIVGLRLLSTQRIVSR